MSWQLHKHNQVFLSRWQRATELPLPRVVQNLNPFPRKPNLEARWGVGIMEQPLSGAMVACSMIVAADTEGGKGWQWDKDEVTIRCRHLQQSSCCTVYVAMTRKRPLHAMLTTRRTSRFFFLGVNFLTSDNPGNRSVVQVTDPRNVWDHFVTMARTLRGTDHKNNNTTDMWGG